MKKFIYLCFLLFLWNTAFSQYLDFAPVGAVWYVLWDCENDGQHPQLGTFSVHEDTVIQGKYCTRLEEGHWPCNLFGERTYVHQDSGKVYRFDGTSQEFKLVLDYTKQAGESWQIELCDDYPFYSDSATIFVHSVLERTRTVTIHFNNGWLDFENLVLLEGAGGFHKGAPLLFFDPTGSDPPCYSYLQCYEDPVLGFVYGSSTGSGGCLTGIDDPANLVKSFLSFFPNPSTTETTLTYRHPPNLKAEIRIFNALGRQLAEYPAMQSEGTLTLPDYPAGLYFVSLMAEGRVLRTERLLKF